MSLIDSTLQLPLRPNFLDLAREVRHGEKCQLAASFTFYVGSCKVDEMI